MFWGAFKTSKKNRMTSYTFLNKLPELEKLFEKNANGKPKMAIFP